MIGAKRLCIAVAGAWCLAVQALEPPLGNNVAGLLTFAAANNPEYATMRYEEAAIAAQVATAGALPDPKFRIELRDITRMGEQNATIIPNQIGSTRYLLMQDIPWFGKRDLKRELAAFELQSAQGQTLNTWQEITAKIKNIYTQLYYLHCNERLTKENLDLMMFLEKIVKVRYVNNLAMQQDIIQIQVEQSVMRNELLALEVERQQMQARMNALLARPTTAPLAAPEQLRPLPAPATLDYAILAERARAHNPQLSAAAARVKVSATERELTYKNRYPDFTFGISPIQYQNSLKEWELMLEVNIPWQRSTRYAQERAAEAMLAATRARQEAIVNQIMADLAEHLAGIDGALRTEKVIANTLLPQVALSYRAALTGYETGTVNFTSLLETQRRIRQVKQNHCKVQTEGQVRLTEIERIVGEEL